jgi:ribonucleoside-diphosphate reductase beta chain
MIKNLVIYGKKNCPFCKKADKLATRLANKGVVANYTYSRITDVFDVDEEHVGLIPTAHRTVPIVFIDGMFIGGYVELTKYLDSTLEKKTKKRSTVFNANATGHETGEYPLFLGEDQGFADDINQPYPILEQLYDEQMGQIWNHEEVDLTQDRQDMVKAKPEVVDLVVKNLLWQTLADSVASRAIGDTIAKYVSNSGLQHLYNAIILFESIHSKTYLHIIKQTFVDPNEALNMGYSLNEVVKRSTLLVDTFDELKNASEDLSEEQLRELVLYCVVVLYLLESINFMTSFAVTFGVAETGIFQGISQNVFLIARDEMLHARAGREVLRIVKAQWPDTWKRLQPRFSEILHTVINDEDRWSEYLFSEGRQMIGLNEKMLKEYTRYMAGPVADTLGVELDTRVKENPLPYMDNYIDSSKVQVANQELQNGNYLVASVRASTQDEINDALSEFN